MGYFTDISNKCTELSKTAQVYLDKYDFISSQDCISRIWSWAWSNMDKDEDGNPIFNGKNELAEDIVDGGVPYSVPPKNGSIHYSLGWSIVAQEANLRSLLEFVEGRQKEWIKFQCLVELD